tara:strand:- start:844 stop:1044 length:201 start_codon:yes stop_codon:yes gene_type:complete
MIIPIDEYIKLIARYMASDERDKNYIYEMIVWMLTKIYKEEPPADATMPNILADWDAVIQHAEEEE